MKTPADQTTEFDGPEIDQSVTTENPSKRRRLANQGLGALVLAGVVTAGLSVKVEAVGTVMEHGLSNVVGTVMPEFSFADLEDDIIKHKGLAN